MTTLDTLLSRDVRVGDDYGAHLLAIKDALHREVAKLTPKAHNAWYTVLADHEYFDGEIEIEAAMFLRWREDYLRGPATCTVCGAKFKRVSSFATLDGRAHWHKASPR